MDFLDLHSSERPGLMRRPRSSFLSVTTTPHPTPFAAEAVAEAAAVSLTILCQSPPSRSLFPSARGPNARLLAQKTSAKRRMTAHMAKGTAMTTAHGRVERCVEWREGSERDVWVGIVVTEYGSDCGICGIWAGSEAGMVGSNGSRVGPVGGMVVGSRLTGIESDYGYLSV